MSVSPTREARIQQLSDNLSETQDPDEQAQYQAEIDRLSALTDEEFSEEWSDEDNDTVTVEQTASSPTEAPKVEDATAPSGEGAPAQDIDPETGKPLSAYKKRLKELNRDALGTELPLELANMMRAAAKKQGDIAVTAWMRIIFADAVNAAGLTTTAPDGTVKAWQFDKSKLEVTQARASTKGLTDEEKEAKKQQAQQASKDQRALVKFLLVEHKVKTGVPINPAEVEVLKANGESGTALLARAGLA